MKRGFIYIRRIPATALHDIGKAGLDPVVDGILEISELDGFASATATKILHPKRRATVPVLDNRAIYGAFLQPAWRPNQTAWGASTKKRGRIAEALHAVWTVTTRPENAQGWATLEGTYPDHERIELFDMCWWTLISRTCELGSNGWQLTRPAADLADHGCSGVPR